VTQEIAVVVAPTRGRSSKQPVAEIRETDGALSTPKFGLLINDGLRVVEPSGDVAETALGIAFVATALGRRVPRLTPTQDVGGLSDCYVELPSLRKKAQNQVSVAPPNSIDSDEGGRGDAGSELRLNQSDIHLELPEDVAGMMENVEIGSGDRYEAVTTVPEEEATEVCSVASIAEGVGSATTAIAMSGVVACGETRDAPTVPGEIATPGHESSGAAAVVESAVQPEAIPQTTTITWVPGSAEEKAAMKGKYDHKQLMLREIAASQLLQEEIAKSDPNLLSVSASSLASMNGFLQNFQQICLLTRVVSFR